MMIIVDLARDLALLQREVVREGLGEQRSSWCEAREVTARDTKMAVNGSNWL